MSRLDPGRRIEVLVVDDSAVTGTILQRLMETDPALRVAGRARDGVEALEKIATLDPDVVTLDFEMPRMDGLETLKRIMRDMPRPVLMLSRFTRRGADITLEALDLGAFDYIPKPPSSSPQDIEAIRDEIVTKIKAAAFAHRHVQPLAGTSSGMTPLPRDPRAGSAVAAIVCIGTSTGGPKALQQILPMLPGDLPVGILVVQHMPQGFTEPFARRLNDLCQLSVRHAVHGEPVQAGGVYVAPAGLHLTVVRPPGSKAAVQLSIEPAGTIHRPSVDITMMSIAREFQSRAMGIILTGMGCDGALGMKAIYEAGGRTIGQDEPTCAIYGMPRACAEAGVLQKVVPLLQIPEQITMAARCSLGATDRLSPGLMRTR